MSRRAHIFLLIFSWSAIGASPRAQTADAVEHTLTLAAEAEAKADTGSALRFYREADRQRPHDPAILQKISKQLSDSVADAPTREERERLAREALLYATRAAALAPEDAACVLSLAICYGKLTSYADTARKVEYVRLTKKYADAALALKPDYDWAHHVLGRWHYELAQIGGPTRALARILYGGLPKGSCAKAVEHLREAARLSPETAAHQLGLAFAYLSCGDRAGAREHFRIGLALPSREKHDETEKTRARAMYEKLLNTN